MKNNVVNIIMLAIRVGTSIDVWYRAAEYLKQFILREYSRNLFTAFLQRGTKWKGLGRDAESTACERFQWVFNISRRTYSTYSTPPRIRISYQFVGWYFSVLATYLSVSYCTLSACPNILYFFRKIHFRAIEGLCSRNYHPGLGIDAYLESQRKPKPQTGFKLMTATLNNIHYTAVTQIWVFSWCVQRNALVCAGSMSKQQNWKIKAFVSFVRLFDPALKFMLVFFSTQAPPFVRSTYFCSTPISI